MNLTPYPYMDALRGAIEFRLDKETTLYVSRKGVESILDKRALCPLLKQDARSLEFSPAGQVIPHPTEDVVYFVTGRTKGTKYWSIPISEIRRWLWASNPYHLLLRTAPKTDALVARLLITGSPVPPSLVPTPSPIPKPVSGQQTLYDALREIQEEAEKPAPPLPVITPSTTIIAKPPALRPVPVIKPRMDPNTPIGAYGPDCYPPSPKPKARAVIPKPERLPEPPQELIVGDLDGRGSGNKLVRFLKRAQQSPNKQFDYYCSKEMARKAEDLMNDMQVKNVTVRGTRWRRH